MRRKRVLALEFSSTLFGFVVLEGPERLIEWGTRGISSDVSGFLPKLGREVERYRPDILVIEDAADSRKGARVREHLAWAEQWATDNELAWSSVSRTNLSDWQAHLGPTKQKRAVTLSRPFPELKPLVPPPRKLWQAESKRLAVFVALARALYHYEITERSS